MSWNLFPKRVQAARWYLGAAEQGDPDVQYDLATPYAAGRGVPLGARPSIQL